MIGCGEVERLPTSRPSDKRLLEEEAAVGQLQGIYSLPGRVELSKERKERIYKHIS